MARCTWWRVLLSRQDARSAHNAGVASTPRRRFRGVRAQGSLCCVHTLLSCLRDAGKFCLATRVPSRPRLRRRVLLAVGVRALAARAGARPRASSSPALHAALLLAALRCAGGVKMSGSTSCASLPPSTRPPPHTFRSRFRIDPLRSHSAEPHTHTTRADPAVARFSPLSSSSLLCTPRSELATARPPHLDIPVPLP
jgi:hypothetical protein